MEDHRPHTTVEVRYRGYGLPESELPVLLRTISTEIDNTWQEEQARIEGQPLTADSYKRVSSIMKPLAQNVIGAAFGWYRQGNEEEKEMGGKILLHYSLPSIFSSIERVKRRYPQAGLDQEDVIERGLLIVMEMINNKGEEHTDEFPERINTYVFNYGQRAFARNIGLPVSWVMREWHIKIPAFREQFLAENGRHPSIEEIIEHFNFSKKKVHQNKRILQRFLYPGEEPEEPIEKVIEKITAEERKAEVSEALLALRGQQRAVLKRLFGLEGGEKKTVKETAGEYGVTVQAIHPLRERALKKLRRPPRAKRLKEYLS